MCSPGEVGEATVTGCVAYDPVSNGMNDTGTADVYVVGLATTLDAGVPLAISVELDVVDPGAVLEFYTMDTSGCFSRAYGELLSEPASAGLHCVNATIPYAQNAVFAVVRNGGSGFQKIKSATVCPNGTCN